jgi:hypothetical protein
MDSHDLKREPDGRPAGDESEGALAGLSIGLADDPAAECARMTDLLRSGETDAFMQSWQAHVVTGEACRVIMDAGLE